MQWSSAMQYGVAPATAMPTSAFLSAGASFTPSPVMATCAQKGHHVRTCIRYITSTTAMPSAACFPLLLMSKVGGVFLAFHETVE